MTAYRAWPEPCQRPARAIASSYARSGVVSNASGSPRSLTTRPDVTRSPTRAASVKSRSTAGAKWEPKTSAVVVPAEVSPDRNSAATCWAYAGSSRWHSSGRAHRSSHSSSGMPSAPMTRTCGKCTWVSTKPGSSTPSRRSMTSSSGWAERTVAKSPRSRIDPVDDQQAGVVVAAQQPAGERVVGCVQHPGPEDRHGRLPGVVGLEGRAPARRRRRGRSSRGPCRPGRGRRSATGSGRSSPRRGPRPPAPAGTGATSPTTRSARSCRGGRSAARRRRARSPRRGRGSSRARACRAAPARAPPPAPASGGRARWPGRRRGRPAGRQRAGRPGSRRGAARGRGGTGCGPARGRRDRRRRSRRTARPPTAPAAG